jgi:hypothetical protein
VNINRRALLPRLLLRLDHPLDDLCLLDQECPEDTGLYAVTASRATVRSANSLLALGDGSILPGTESRDTRKPNSTITTLGLRGELFEVVVDEFAAWCLDDTAPVRDGVVRLALAKSHPLCHCSILTDG